VEKLVYLLRRPHAQMVGAFREELLGDTAQVIEASGARALTLNVADIDAIPESIHMSDPQRELGACFSIWLDTLDARGPIEERLRSVSDGMAGYLVAESMAREYADRDWPDGTRSPGVTLTAVFPKRADLSEESFFAHWHDIHTPLSLEMHPLTRYVRDTISRAITPGAPRYLAHVEERVRELEDIADPLRFYGSLEAQREAEADTARFCDVEQMRTALMSEYILQSGPQ